MPVIGTAGHVDHGKSTLVKRLTGRDPDRWEEEKTRGLTIDLGFAWTTLPGGLEVSFVDVPGHERFIKNMLAGTDGFDVALFVVAADEGWMPQSEEHLAVLDLLGVEHGVVALTKVDRVEDDLRELAMLEVSERLEATVFENAPIVPVSAVEGEGIEDLQTALAAAAGSVSVEDVDRPRMWIDRAFTISGAGTVVTGTLTGGGLTVGDQMQIWPGPVDTRVRALQSHEQSHADVGPGARVAANLVGADRQAIERGAMLGRPGDWAPSSRMLVTMRAARYLDEPLTNRGAYHLHLGSGAWPARLRTIEDMDDEWTLATLSVDQPIPVKMGDRFVLREVGRRSIVAGGRVIEPIAPRRSNQSTAAAPALRLALKGSADDRASALLDARGVEALAVLSAHSGGGKPTSGTIAGDTAMSSTSSGSMTARANALVEAFHADHPLRPGMPTATLASALGADRVTMARVLDRAGLVEHGSTVTAPDFEPCPDPGQEAAWREAKQTLTTVGLKVPRLKDL
ncbi:MAG TPA: selenocysteine-specific translation elongation factor, partial [Actinobacteria bacterium]|nr:selenocysteine-specific translation elongation factor [Actinomycetota bacterium]